MAKIISEIGHQLIPFPQCRPATLRRPTGIRCSVFATPSHEVNASGARVVPWGSEIESLESASALKNWLSASGLPPQKLEIRRVDVGERGLVALKNIRKGEKLLFVPPSLVITADSVWSCPEVGNVLKKNSVPDWPLLATYLISEASFKSSSRWSSYITALPRQPYSLLYWTLTELDTYLVASQIRERAIERITNVIGTYEDLRLRIFSKHQDLFPEEVYNIDTFLWSFGILFSRLVETFLDYDKSSKGIVFMADQSYQLGEQVFISYGKKSNGELLLSYGFVPKDGTNPNDSVELSLSLKKSDKCYKEKLEALRKYGLQVPQRFPLQITGWPVEMMAYSYLVVSPPNMRQYFEEMAAAASSRAASETGRKYPELEEQALQYLLDCCESSISKYSKFLQDGDTLNSGQLSAKQADRKSLLKKLATDLCTSEQRILFRAQYILRRRLQDMRNGELRALTILNGFRKLFK
ncbi:ribulose-1,5 bisphosphate carboxylase/oxygenase large subunit N-methyltransferase, chloroplastic-like isoform X4 [Zingiber officinale]|uniref:ribulose-1,5 bisphosphate carboxylase/oxygenase large subunit N-methyltransferase, chloroplastic-like isoform X4 n=1 Tax=Zingiber officinale TaxID=94328 RepID=UPI001C4C4BDC|nr:ribulose-1,5 bisphosphate carboxylase/oxygenase large subunit N-methyltransferase, chloroplastic-like isoform X4 [Zingiber officinale]